MSADRGSTIPLILGFFVLALLVVGGSVALGEAFVQQRDLQDVCDGAAVAAAAGAVDPERGGGPPADALPFADAEAAVRDYLARDPQRRDVRVRVALDADRRRITLRCEQTTSLALGQLVGRGHVHHVATSSARAVVRAVVRAEDD